MTRYIILFAVCVSLGGAPAFAGNWNVPTTAKDIPNPVAWNAATAEHGRQLYANNCVECHGLYGAGDGTKEQVEYDLRGILAPLTDGELYWKMTHGVGRMPSFAGVLTDEERWVVIHHLRRLGETTSAGATSPVSDR